MHPTEMLRTDRLVGRRLRAEDFDDLARMHRDPRVMATLAPAGAPNGGLLSADETRRFLRRNLEHWERHGYGLWMFRDRADGRFVGRGGLKRTSVDGKDEVELAYAVLAGYWGRGLATEMAEAILAAGFEHLGLAAVVCFTLTTNRASRRVSEQAGFRYHADFVAAGLPAVFHRLTAADWRDAHAPGPHAAC